MEAVGRRAAEVAHDLRNVVTAILGFSTLVLEKARDPETRANAKEIVKAGERAAVLSTRLLTFGRRGIVRPQALDLHAFLRELEPLLRRLVKDRVAVHVQFAAEPLRIAADGAQLEQVILNLVANASDAMPDGGALTLRTASRTVEPGQRISGVPVAAGLYAEITIVDTGQGMCTATLARAFEPFFTTKPIGEGTGLGLSTAYGIVKNSRGYLWLESAPGRGTTATIQLPREAPKS
jgi:two-component system, cell cycle sensor histidine kinase and response regulator CckA